MYCPVCFPLNHKGVCSRRKNVLPAGWDGGGGSSTRFPLQNASMSLSFKKKK